MSSSPRRRVLASWSSGKDSAWMLHVLRQDPEVEVVGLVTTFAEGTDRVAMHGVPRSLVERQATAAGLPLRSVFLPWPCPNSEYEARLSNLFREAVVDGVTHIAFGDLFLEEIRDYRIGQLAGTGLEPLFPIWCGPEGTADLARRMIESGLRATLTCVDSQQLDPAFVGRPFDANLLRDLPPTVDPCGERGEFHTFCWSGPHQANPVSLAFRTGAVTDRDGFVFAEPILAD